MWTATAEASGRTVPTVARNVVRCMLDSIAGRRFVQDDIRQTHDILRRGVLEV